METRERIWYSWVDAKTNEYYTSYVTKKYQICDWILNTFLVLSTSASIAAWAIWEVCPLLWGIIIALSQVLMLIKPFLLFPKYIRVYNEKNINLQNLSCDLENLWCSIEAEGMCGDYAIKEYEKIQKGLIETDKFPDDIIVFSHKKALTKAEKKSIIYINRFNNGQNR